MARRLGMGPETIPDALRQFAAELCTYPHTSIDLGSIIRCRMRYFEESWTSWSSFRRDNRGLVSARIRIANDESHPTINYYIQVNWRDHTYTISDHAIT